MTGEMHRRHFLIGLIAGTAGAKISDIANAKGGTAPIIRPEKTLEAAATPSKFATICENWLQARNQPLEPASDETVA